MAEAVPSEVFPRELITIPSNIRSADPNFHLSRPVDLLIGSEATLSFLSIGQLNLTRDNCDLYLQKILLGWVIAGGISREIKGPVSCNLTDLNVQLARFWEIEEISEPSPKSLEEVACEAHYKANVQRIPDGRYIVRLPFKTSIVELGSSKCKAFQRFKALERKFQTNPQFFTQYAAVIQNFLDLGHMTLVEGDCQGEYYLPHPAVIKPGSSTTKTRVVFDASAKTDKDTSLNAQLMVGPTIQPKLLEILFRFYAYMYVMTADIEQMYKQILLDSRDSQFQRIFWYHNGTIRTFELNTVTFGVASVPFSAIRTLQQLAEDEKLKYPLAYEILKNNFYVDDTLASANSLDEIIQTRDEVIQLLHSGGFNIRKWIFNYFYALDSLEEAVKSIAIGEGLDGIQKTLGVDWDSTRDNFVYSTKRIDLPHKITKRHILPEVAKIFDPLGPLGPIILHAKLIMQDCWKTDYARLLEDC